LTFGKNTEGENILTIEHSGKKNINLIKDISMMEDKDNKKRFAVEYPVIYGIIL
jgi:hypothetical protein